MNQSPKKNKYIIRTKSSAVSLFFTCSCRSNTYIVCGNSLLLMVVNLHWKRICSKGGEPGVRGGILDAKFLYLGKRDPRGSQPPGCHCSAFTQEQFNLVLFRTYQLNTRVGSASASSEAAWKAAWLACLLLAAVGASSWDQCLLDVQLVLYCLAQLAVLLAPASQINYSVTHPASQDGPQRWQRSRRLSCNRDGIGQAVK